MAGYTPGMPSRSSVAQVARSIAGRPGAESVREDAAPSAPIGVVFVHGIGTQPPRETLLNWANPIVEMLAEWRREYDEGTTDPTHTIGEDPVEAAGIERADGWDERAWVRIAIPGTGAEHPADHAGC